jgi:hypothetical protein
MANRAGEEYEMVVETDCTLQVVIRRRTVEEHRGSSEVADIL